MANIEILKSLIIEQIEKTDDAEILDLISTLLYVEDKEEIIKAAM